jgi:hypothetical protein
MPCEAAHELKRCRGVGVAWMKRAGSVDGVALSLISVRTRTFGRGETFSRVEDWGLDQWELPRVFRVAIVKEGGAAGGEREGCRREGGMLAARAQKGPYAY